MNSPYGREFQLDFIKSLWKKKTANDEQFLESRKQDMKIFEEHLNSLPHGEKYLILLNFHSSD